MLFQILGSLLFVILADESSALTIDSSQVVANPASSSYYPFAISLFNRFWNGFKVRNNSWSANAVYSGLANFEETTYGSTYSNEMTFYFVTPYSGYPVCLVQFESEVVLVNIDASAYSLTIKVYNTDGSKRLWSNIYSRIYITCLGSLDPYSVVKRNHL